MRIITTNIIIIIIIIIILVITFMHGIYNYIPETNHVTEVHGVASCSIFTLCATCNVISPVKYVLYLYISTSRSLCAAPNMAVYHSS
jgi:disulfide bond formation protein DsbB